MLSFFNQYFIEKNKIYLYNKTTRKDDRNEKNNIKNNICPNNGNDFMFMY